MIDDRMVRTPSALLGPFAPVAEADRRQLSPLELTFLALPMLYVFGIAGFMWAFVGVGCLVVLADRGDFRLPFGSVALVVGLSWALLSSVGLLGDGLGALLLGGYRWAVLLSTLGVFLFVANRLDAEGAHRVVVIAMTTVWCSLVGFGLASLVLPELAFGTAAQRLLPQAFLSNSYLVDLTSFRLSEIQYVRGEASSRPAAPFAYANGWGSSYALSAPVAYLWLIEGRRGARRAAGVTVFAIGTMVAIASLNRAVWLLLALCAVYAVVRSRQRIRLAVTVLPVAVCAGWITLAFTPLGARITSRLEIAGESDRTRSDVIDQSLAATVDSPAFGYGAPIDGFGNVPIGTHGFLWFLLVSYGVIAAIAIVGWLVGVTVASATLPSPAGKAAHLVLLVAVLQLPVYGMLPQLPLVGLAAALTYHCRRELQEGIPHD